MSYLPLILVGGAVVAAAALALSGDEAVPVPTPEPGKDAAGGPAETKRWIPRKLRVRRFLQRAKGKVKAADLAKAKLELCAQPEAMSASAITTLLISVALPAYMDNSNDLSAFNEGARVIAAAKILALCEVAPPMLSSTANALARAAAAIATGGYYDEVGRQAQFQRACEGSAISTEAMLTLIADYGVRGLRQGWTYQNIVVSLPSAQTCEKPGGAKATAIARAVAESAVRLQNAGFA